jgi:N-acetylmuramoyl-L-alanine amidase
VAIRKSTAWIAIHCSATRPAMDIGAREIRQWHMQPRNKGGLGAKDIGYHFVIRRNGLVEKGRAVDVAGAHVAGFNATSVGVCLVGGVNQADFRKAENNFTPAQWVSLRALVAGLVQRYPRAKVRGHRDFPDVAKACPSFDARAWARKEGFPT